ncbi:MAG: HAD-IC family P-type ATPase, partial [Vicinamibacterales bacterium]
MATRPWHALPASEVLAGLGSGAQGLSAAEADRRLREVGPNQLAPPVPTSAAAILRAQFRGVVMLLLLSAGALSLAMGDRLEAAAIGVVIAINAALGFTLELRARRAMEALMHLGATRATVMRDGRLLAVDARTLVPGDLIDLAAGQTVPADARVVEDTDLRTSEAALTGESLPVSKQAAAAVAEDTSLADRDNMVYRGTMVSRGVGRAVVTATGNATEVGRIGVLTRAVVEGPTPLERRLDALGRRLVWVTLGVAVLVGGLGILQGVPWTLMLETSIALAVAAVPEGLPAVATIALAVGLRRMARRHALVRRLSAVEALGSTTVICTDKTRTLTTGDMAVTRGVAGGTPFSFPLPVAASPEDRQRLLALFEAARAASRAAVAAADDHPAAPDDPVDFAIRTAAEALDLQAAGSIDAARLQHIPFSSERRFAAGFAQAPAGRFTASVKGAPRTVLEMCGSALEGGRVVPLASPDRTRLLAENEALAGDGLRVLGVASGDTPEASAESLRDLVFVG